ncbi:MAG: glycosyltransferase family 1 protein, partial [Clostridia bacterium]|nr:glycosyltransferase family 1 protein [Clostridia bacterium]
MTEYPIRIAQMMTNMNYGGVETAIMNYYRYIDNARIQFDFFAFEGSLIPQKELIESLGGKVYIVPRCSHLIKYEHEIQKLLKNYLIVHSNMNTLSALSLYGAKKAGVQHRILHNHSTAGKGEKKNIFKYILRPFCHLYYTEAAACSARAGEWMFGKGAPFRIINNAINLSEFRFNQNTRDRIRNELKINDKFVIGHIGRFCFAKNQEFIVDIFNEISKSADAVLLLIGSGKSKSDIESKVIKLGLDKKVIFLGNRLNINEYYQAMDTFVFPSRYEGLGMVAIEAQASGLPVTCSTEVPSEVAITDLVKFCPLSASPSEWAESILNNTVNCRRDTTDEIRTAGYDIVTEAKKLEDYYL